MTHELPREMADQVPREMLVLDGVGQCEAEAIYLDVPDLGARIGGGAGARAARRDIDMATKRWNLAEH